jgi:hypothetical protein
MDVCYGHSPLKLAVDRSGDVPDGLSGVRIEEVVDYGATAPGVVVPERR